MPRQVIQDSVDISVETTSELTTQIDDRNVSDGTRVWMRGAGSEHGLWCLDQLSVLPLGPNVVPTGSGTGRWIYYGSGFAPPPPPSSGSPYEFIFRPLEPAPSGNVYDSWPLLVAAAAAAFGQKLVYFDNSLAPCVIPTGIWDFGSATIFTGDIGRPSAGGPTPAPTPLTIDDGALLRNVFEFKSLDITSNSTSAVNAAPFPGARYTFSGTTRVTQTDPGGEFIRSATGFVFSPVEVVLLESAKFLTGGGPVVNVTNPGATAVVYALDNSEVQPDTIAASGPSARGFVVDSASIAIAQTGFPGGIFPVTLLSIAALVSYDDTLVLPLLGVADVQAAIDALKSTIPQIYKFAGTCNGLGLAVTFFLSDNLPGAAIFGLAINYPVMLPATTFEARFKVSQSTTGAPTTVHILKNGVVVDGAGTVVPAGAGGLGDYAVPITATTFTPGVDHLDFSVDFAAGEAGKLSLAGMTMLR